MNWGGGQSNLAPRNIGNPYIRLCIQNSEDLVDQPVHELNGAHRLDRHLEVSQRQKVCLCNRPYGARTGHQASRAFQPRNRRKCTNRLRGLSSCETTSRSQSKASLFLATSERGTSLSPTQTPWQKMILQRSAPQGQVSQKGNWRASPA